MKAIVYTEYGSPAVLQLKEVAQPKPKANEILIKVKATAVNSGDWRLRKADPFAVRLFFGLTKPKINILGGVFSGEVEAVGEKVSLFKVGDSIFGSMAMLFGAYAEYVCLPETGVIALKPSNLTHQEAAVIPFGGLTALYFLQKANIKKGQKVLIYGASGAIGTAAVQLAKHFGASVVGVCSAANADLIKSLGADKVIDYNKENIAQSTETYDVIFDTVNKMPVGLSARLLNKKGVLVLGAAELSEMLHGAWISMTSKKKVLMGVIGESVENLVFLKGLLEKGGMKPVIDRTYLLEQMADAHTYVEKGHKKGNVAIAIIA